MKALLKAIPVVRSAKESKDGKSVYYSVGLVQNGDLIEFNTNEQVYKGLEMYKDSTFEMTLSRGEYQGKVYERRSITAIIK